MPLLKCKINSVDLRTENRAIIFEKNWIFKVIAVLN